MTDYNALAGQFFEKYDENSNGTLCLGEFTKLWNDFKAERPELELDLYTSAEHLFNTFDLDKDGFITLAEFATFLQTHNF